MALTSTDLDQLVCSDEDCSNTACSEQMFFHSPCHPTEPTWVMYDGEMRVLVVTCSVCNQPVATVKVASGY
jgi:hypothetical protein